MLRLTTIIFLLFTIWGCGKDSIYPDFDPNAEMVFPVEADANGYYHVPLNWTGEYYPYFNLTVNADNTPEWAHYNDMSVVTGEFDTDTYFVLGDSLAFTIPLYSPYLGLQTYEGFPIPIRDTIVYLDQFAGTIVPIVQNDTRIYFTEEGERMTSTRVVGPFPPELIGDTISIYMRIKWDIGDILEKDHYIEKFIVE
tara:strand:+ start:4020 stop:4607 length:588 start_codon:yes stop_codon:yes gene_type:complete